QATGASADSGTVLTDSADISGLSAQDSITARLRNSGFLLNIAAFFGFGLLLSLTPCIFPMIPILSGIIVGQNSVRRVTAWSGFLLSVAYVVAMALTYAVLGMIAGSFNFNLQAASQNVWALSAFSAVFVLLALSMFGFYQLQLPASWQTRLQAIGSERSGSLLGAAIMGVLSAIIVGPCVAPPLAGALLYISQTGDALLGGLALFALGLGLGMPLLLLGAAGGQLLPQAGVWMNTVKQVFGVIMLGVAIWFLERLFAGPVTLMLWALLLIVSAVYMGALDTLAADARWQRLWKGLGLAMLVYGVVLIVAAVGGGKDPLRPLQGSDWLQPVSITTGSPNAVTDGQSGNGEQLEFEVAADADAARAAILQAGLEGKPAMLYFTAAWCIVCEELEQYTFRDADVVRALNGFSLI
ncbi:MAG: protein-disulfide reductase DsbD, partial [Gammaproteobacteria bacterium]